MEPVADPRQLTDLQLAILRILWDRGEATTHTVHKALQPQRPLALTTVATLLSRLARRGVLGYRREGRHFVYRPRVTRQEVRRSMVEGLTEGLFGGDPAALVRHLLTAGDVKTGDLARLRELIDAAEGASGE